MLAMGELENVQTALENIASSEEVEPLKTLFALAQGAVLDAESLPERVPGLSTGERYLLVALVNASKGDYRAAELDLKGAREWARTIGQDDVVCQALLDQISIEDFKKSGDERMKELSGMIVGFCEGLLKPGTMNMESGTATLFAVLGKIQARRGSLLQARKTYEILSGVQVQSSRVWAAYRDMLGFEIAVQERANFEEEEKKLRKWKSLLSFQIDESLAYGTSGRGGDGYLRDLAGRRRGLALMECSYSCYGRMHSVLLFSQSSESSEESSLLGGGSDLNEN